MRKFYLCRTCGNLIEKIEDGGNTPYCCGRQMVELTPASTDGATEKHVPVTSLQTTIDPHTILVKIHVGSDPHPTEIYHYIKWIALETDKGTQIKHLSSHDKPVACFLITADETIQATYAYCNLHGLWKA